MAETKSGTAGPIGGSATCQLLPPTGHTQCISLFVELDYTAPDGAHCDLAREFCFGARLCVRSTPAAARRMEVGQRVFESRQCNALLQLVSDTAALRPAFEKDV
jgi:hypothetical protein